MLYTRTAGKDKEENYVKLHLVGDSSSAGCSGPTGKVLGRASLSQVDTIPLISGVFHLTYVQNFGAAFNTMNNQRFLLVGVTSAVLLLILVLLLTQKLRSPWMICSWSLILSGGAGNLVDRLFRPGRLCGGPV